jgi:natural resistance-associated macrophage protein
LKELPRGGESEIKRIALDTSVGMVFSNLIAFFIILTTAAVLHANGVTNIRSAAEAAEALRPLAGDLTFVLFALGIIGTGLLAVPVLAGSAAYCVAEAFGWPATLEAKAPDAVGFYSIIAAATVVGLALGYTPIDPIQMLILERGAQWHCRCSDHDGHDGGLYASFGDGSFQCPPDTHFFRMGWHSADGRYCCCTILVVDWLIRALIASNAFRTGRPISSKGNSSLTVAIECLNLDWHCLLYHSVCYFFGSSRASAGSRRDLNMIAPIRKHRT